jgi:hypothetical protein
MVRKLLGIGKTIQEKKEDKEGIILSDINRDEENLKKIIFINITLIFIVPNE